MRTKNNIRSIRFSDELAELIDRQVGNTFTQKFENLVTRCVWELPAKEAELKKMEARMEEKQQQVQQLNQQIQMLKQTINGLLPKALDLERALTREMEKWNM